MSNFATILICLLLTIILSNFGSYWIDKLYTMPNAPLTFPDEVNQRARYRKPLLTFAMFCCTFYFVEYSLLPENFYLIVASFFLLLITFTDFEQYVIFDRMTLPFALIGIAATIHLNLQLNMHIGSALVGGGIFLILAAVTRGALGGGDVKLIAALGIWLGPHRLFNVIITGCIAGGIVALIMILLNQKDRKSFFAYGPYFTLATLIDLIRFSHLE